MSKKFGHTARERADQTGQVAKKLASQANVDVSTVSRRWDILVRACKAVEGSVAWLSLVNEARALGQTTASTVNLTSASPSEYDLVREPSPVSLPGHEFTLEIIKTIGAHNASSGMIATNPHAGTFLLGSTFRRQSAHISQGVHAI